MKSWLVSLNGAIALGIIALLTLLARLTFLDALYVPEFRVLLPANQPATLALTMIGYILLIGLWLWSLLAATRGSRAGLMVALLFSLLTALGGGLYTITTLCPNGCDAPPVGDGIVWANLIAGLMASLALGFHLARRSGSMTKAARAEGGLIA